MRNKNLKTFISIIKPHRLKLIAGIALTTLGFGASLAIPQILSHLINDVLHPGVPTTVVLSIGAIVAGLAITESTLVFSRRFFTLSAGSAIEFKMRKDLFNKLQRLPIAFHDKWESGQLLSRFMSDMADIRRFIGNELVFLVSSTLMLVMGIVVMISQNPLLAGIFTALLIPGIYLRLKINKKFEDVARAVQEKEGDMATDIEQSVQGIRVLKAFGQANFAVNKYALKANDARRLALKRTSTYESFYALMMFLPEATIAVSMLVGIWLITQDAINLGNLSAFFVTGLLLQTYAGYIAPMLSSTSATMALIARNREVMEAEETVQDPENPVALPEDTQVKLELQSVRFGFADDDVLQDVSLTLNPGETVALVGATGSGKTALLQLIPRFYDVAGGKILLNGVDIRNLSVADLRRVCAFAFEEATLFSGTVRENILLGSDLPDFTSKQADDMLRTCLEASDAVFAYDLPDGVETKIGEQGLSLSGGQRQRIALARAIAAKPKILLLDDPLSALDTATEERVSNNLRTLLEDTTTLIVAHRSSTVMLADRVALLKDGSVKAVGTHRELLETSAEYRELMLNTRDLLDIDAVSNLLITKKGDA